MQLKINDIALAIGDGAPPADLAAAGFQRPGLLRRLFRREPRGGRVYETADCIVTCFDEDFELYPCNHAYLTDDRRWRTSANLLVRENRLFSAVLEVVDATYAASEFVARFQDSCTGNLGEPHHIDRYTRRWRNGTTEVASLLRPDGKNAAFVFELKTGG